jgi:2-hydroxychromene-2-carboxylate isomerase
MTAFTKTRIDWGFRFALAAALGLAESDLRDALATSAYKPKVRADFLGDLRSGVNGTPSFFINGERHDGSHEFGALVAAIETRLHAGATL